MFLFLATMSLAGTMAFAQDDYDYGDSYGTEEAASTPDESSYEGSYESSAPAAAEQPASDVEYKSMDDESKKTSRDDKERSLFNNKLNFGFHMGFGISMLYATEITGTNIETQKDVANNYGDDLFGGAIEIGAGIAYSILDDIRLAAVAEPSLEFKMYSANLGTYRIWTTDDYGYDTYYISDVSIDNLMVGLKLPVFIRYYPQKDLYVQLGLSFELNLSSSTSYSDSDGNEIKGLAHQNLIGDDGTDKNVYKYFDVNSFVMGLNFGMGTTIALGNLLWDAEIRLILDMMPMIKFNDGFHTYTMDTYKEKYNDSDAKSWQVQIVLKPWF